MAEPIIPVEVMVLESCPEHAREHLKFARDEIYKAFLNSSNLHETRSTKPSRTAIWLRKTLDSKTIGVMHVHFSDRSENTIFAISGQGMKVEDERGEVQ